MRLLKSAFLRPSFAPHLIVAYSFLRVPFCFKRSSKFLSSIFLENSPNPLHRSRPCPLLSLGGWQGFFAELLSDHGASCLMPSESTSQYAASAAEEFVWITWLTPARMGPGNGPAAAGDECQAFGKANGHNLLELQPGVVVVQVDIQIPKVLHEVA